jgi:hypothetical protein
MVVLTSERPRSSQGNSLRQDRRQVGLVEDANQVSYFALQRNCQAKDGQKVRELDSQLHRTHVRLWDADPFGERLLAQPAFQTDLANASAEQLACGRCVSGMSHLILTNQLCELTLFNS